jgi:hypothetical protein
MMVISRLLVSGFKTQTNTPPNPGRNRCIVHLNVLGQGTTMKGIKWKKKQTNTLMTY